MRLRPPPTLPVMTSLYLAWRLFIFIWSWLTLNSWVLLGETGPIIPVSPARVTAVLVTDTGMEVDVVGAPGERVVLAFADCRGATIVWRATQIGGQGRDVVHVSG